MAAGDNRGHGGNVGYDDQIDAYYSWDSNVPNHRKIQVGDPIALWDKERLLGVSVIEAITTKPGQKVLNRCPACGTTRISERKRVEPRFRCMKCQEEFAAPRVGVVEVVTYEARYDAAWTPLVGLLNDQDLRSLAVKVGDINAMRPLKWSAFLEALLDRHAERAVARVGARAPDLVWPSAPLDAVDIPGGFRRTMVRVRRGQQRFREDLLARQGEVCAFTGGAPARVLEAGHLYSYAQLGTHAPHGGLMLRRDIHRLFDDGLLAVDPSRLRVDVASDLATYPQYARLHDQCLATKPEDGHIDWLAKHWDQHRATRATVV